MNWNMWIRHIHRWLSIIFTLTVIANFVTMARGQPPGWVVYSPLPPLFLLLFTGLYMFALPYLGKSGERRAVGRTGAMTQERSPASATEPRMPSGIRMLFW